MTLKEVTMVAEEHLNCIAECFKPNVKITFIARTPENDNADFVLTNDSKEGLFQVIERMKE